MSLAAQLLLEFVLPQPNRQRIQSIAQDPSFPWKDFFSLADRHRMSGLIAPQLQGMLDGQLPEELFAPWRKRQEELVFQDLRQMAALEEIFRAASQGGLTPLVLKGFSIHLQVDTFERTTRGSNDLDLLVRPVEVLRMKQCLEKLGFSFRGTDSWSQPVSDWEKFVDRDCEALFCRLHPPVAVDLHWRLCAPRLERSCGLTLSDRIWQRTRTIPVGGIRLLIPGREEEILFLCLHLFKGGTLTLRNLLDLAQLLGADPPVDWNLLLQIGGESGTLGCAYYAFRLVEELTPGAIPEWVRPALRQAGGPSWILSPFLKIERLLRTQGESLTDLSTFWSGVLFAQRPWRWFRYQAGRIARWLIRRAGGMLR